MEIPITISLKGNVAELERDLFGLGEIVKDPDILKILGPKGEPPRYVNKSAVITEGVTISHPQIQRFAKAMESLETSFVDYHYVIYIVSAALGLGINVYTITDWFLNKIQKYDCKIMINNKEVKTRDELQQTLDEYIKNNSN